MKSKIDNIINITILILVGIFFINCIYKYLHYINNLEYYMVNSAPWYLDLQIHGIITLVLLVIGFLVKYLLDKKLK